MLAKFATQTDPSKPRVRDAGLLPTAKPGRALQAPFLFTICWTVLLLLSITHIDPTKPVALNWPVGRPDDPNARIAPFKVPVRLWQEHETLPRLGTEKVDKRALRARYQTAWESEQAV